MIRQLAAATAGACLFGLGMACAFEGVDLVVALSGWTLVAMGAAAMTWAVGAK